MKRKGLSLTLALSLALALSMTSYAGQWKEDEIGWWWEDDNGNYPSSCWQWIDGNRDGVAECYYFNDSGYLWEDVFQPTPDGYYIGDNGEWLADNIVQKKVIDEKLAQSVKTRLPYEGLYTNSQYEIIKDNSEYYGQYNDLLPGKVYTYESLTGELTGLQIAVIELEFSADCANSDNKVYYRTIKETEDYKEEDYLDENGNPIGKYVSYYSKDNSTGYVRIFGYY